MDKNYKVYMHERKSTGQKYFGITSTDVNTRWRNGKGYSTNNRFWGDIQKDGWNEGFNHIILQEGLSQEEALVLETSYILQYQTYLPEKGYNKRIQEHCRNALSQEARNNLSQGQKKRYEREEEHIKQSLQTKQRLAQNPALKERSIQALQNWHQSLTPEEKKLRDNTQGYAVKCLETGKSYATISEAARQTGCDRKGINRCVLGQALSISGKHWVRADDNSTTIEMIESRRKKSGRARKVKCIETGEIFLSIGEAEAKYGGDVQHCVMGLQKTAAGYHWEYHND